MNQYRLIEESINDCCVSYQEMKKAVQSVLQNGKQGEI